MLETSHPFTDLINLGQTSVKPATTFYWDSERNTVLELTELTDQYYLIQASKSYHLLKQDEKQQETWDSNLIQLNQYLSDTFNRFRLSIEYVNEVTPEALPEKNQARKLAEKGQELSAKAEKIREEQSEAETYVNLVDGNRKKRYQDKLNELKEQGRANLDEMKQTADQIQAIRDYIYKFKKNGVMLAYLFTFSTTARPVHKTDLPEVAEHQLESVYNTHQTQVKQTLQGSKFKLKVDEVTHPRVLMRQEHSLMHNPDLLNHFQEENQQLSDQFTESLEKLQNDAVHQYMAYALEDINTGNGLRERSKSTPSRAVNSILQELPSEDFTDDIEKVPQNGPLIGQHTKNQMLFGFDPADGEHYYIVGETGSGKSYLKRVLIENSIDLGYDVLTINPGDKQVLSAAFKNDIESEFDEHKEMPVTPDHAKSLMGDFYWPSHELLLDLPDDTTELFTGANFICLNQLSTSEQDEFITELFEALAAERDRTKPLMVFLDEANKFSQAPTGDKIQEVVREARKFGIHVFLATQSPMDFNRNYKHIRENTTGNFFLNGEYDEYAKKFDLPGDVTDLNTAQAYYFDRDTEPFKFNARPPLSRVPKTSKDRLEKVDQLYQPNIPDQFKGKRQSGTITVEEDQDGEPEASSLSADEEKELEFIKDWIREHDEAPTYSKCHREGPFSTSKTRRLLDQLKEKNVLEEDVEDRYGNQSQIYRPT